MNKYEFYSKLLQEDFPVKYRQDFAEHDSEQCKKIADLKAQLAEAVELLRESELWSDGTKSWLDKLHTFLARHAQAEKQGAQDGRDDDYVPEELLKPGVLAKEVDRGNTKSDEQDWMPPWWHEMSAAFKARRDAQGAQAELWQKPFPVYAAPPAAAAHGDEES